MTKDEYQQQVNETAASILTQCDVKKWVRENPDEGFHKFYDDMEYDGSISSILDATCNLGDWKKAVELLSVTEQDPDQVDSGLYEGCKWHRILICIAFECWSWDVRAVLEEKFKNQDFAERLMEYPDTKHQKGYSPALKRFKVPKGPWVVDLGNGVKILIPGHVPRLSVVFEGHMKKKRTHYLIDCLRVYNQTESDIDDDLEEVMSTYGVEEV